MMNFLRPNNNTKQADERLGQAFYTNNRYNPLFIGAAGIGFVVIYILGFFGFLGKPAPQLLYISGAIFFLAVTQLPILDLAHQKKGVAANFLTSLSVTIFAILLVSFWEGIVPVVIVVIFITSLISIFGGLPLRYYPYLLLLVIASVFAVLYVDAHPWLRERLQTNTIAAIASLAFLGATGLLLLTATVIARSRRYRSLRNQLLTSFIIIITIPTLMATILSAIGAYANNESQALNVLETVSKLKKTQINGVIDSLKFDALTINKNPEFKTNILYVLTPQASNQGGTESYRASARSQLIDFRHSKVKIYSELIVLDINGDVIISTDPTREGKSLRSELFYIKGSLSDFAGFTNNPSFNNSDLIFSTPIYDPSGKVIRGILVLRANSNLIDSMVESTPSYEGMETYLVDKDFHPLTLTHTIAETIHTTASDSILTNSSIQDGKGTYENYAHEVVLGYYQRIESLNTVFITEVPRAVIVRNSINSLLGSATLAFLVILIAIVAIAISAASIAEPISSLASIAESFATGNLSSRAAINRQDEIGALGKAYDQMAEQLQDIIGKLEQRVADRTKELESQTLRLRTSAEIARDSASAHNLNELLNKAGTLIQERFGLYHTGIFLLDNNKEYAVLTASPTEAGKQMIANDHKLRIGEVGIVGRVAYTAEPRITLDTGTDAAYFNNPLLPKTRSEMALPLKVENRMIGVLDVQSEQPQAFNKDDVAIMQILADQLATAIERTRLIQQVEKNLTDLQKAYGQFTREGWKTLGESGFLGKTGYRFDNIRIQPITEISESGNEAMRSGNPVLPNNQNNQTGESQVAIPIKLRGQTIGVVSAKLKEGYTPNTISTLELAIERLALSLESARLYEEARLRADREQTIAQVATNITSANGFDAILRTTVEEIGRSIGDTEVSIQIISEVEKTDK